MHSDERRTRQVLAVVRELDGRIGEFGPAHVQARLRELGQPMGAWEVRGELQRLRGRGLLEVARDSARWHLTETPAQTTAS